MRWRSLFRNCAISRKVAGFISDEVFGTFYLLNFSSFTVTFGFTQPLI